jgi:glycosyltransferase involved in cell wall biosynthesis
MEMFARMLQARVSTPRGNSCGLNRQISPTSDFTVPAAPTVSILIPAFRPTWINEAIQSALAQTFTDFELIISDDSADDEVEKVVSTWSDRRLQYFRNPTRGAPGSNRDFLISRARGEYIKFLFDDDFLYGHSLELLFSIASRTGCALAFHSRNVVDDYSNIIEQPRFAIQPDSRDRFKSVWFKLRGSVQECIRAMNANYDPRNLYHVDSKFFFGKMIGCVANLIGEPSNILIHAPTLRNVDKPFSIDGRRMRFLTDMALYSNFMARGLSIVGTDNIGSAFRVHRKQNSGHAYPGYSAGIFEWELLGRWAVDAGELSLDSFKSLREVLTIMYRSQAENFGELNDFLALGTRTLARPLLNEEFESVLSKAYEAIEKRLKS